MRRSALAVRAMVLAYALLTAAAIVLLFLNRSERTSGDIVLIGVFSLSHFVGALVASRRPRNAVGWLLAGAPLVVVLAFFAQQYARYGVITAPGALPGARVMYWLATWPWVGMFAGVLFTALLFPDGRLPSPRWRPFAWGAGAFMTFAATVFAFAPVVGEHPALVNPFGVEALRGTAEMLESTIGFMPFLFMLASAVLSLVVRFRRSHGLERQQLKWAASAVAVTVVGFLAGDLFPDDSIFSDIAFGVALAALPLAIGVAMLRYRLYDIDILINRTLVYAATTAVIGVTFFGVLLAVQTVLRPFTGGGEIAVAVSTLGSFAVFHPVRVRAQRFVDRRFYRDRYDARKTIDAFAAHLRQEVDLDEMSDELVAVVRQTVQPSHVSLWLRDVRR